MKTAIAVLLLTLVLCAPAHADPITPAEASAHIGQKATVCGVVASATFASRTKGQPTFLNLDQPYPKQIFTVVIWGRDRDQFSGAPELVYRGKRLCVTGLVESFRGKAEITVKIPSQIQVDR